MKQLTDIAIGTMPQGVLFGNYGSFLQHFALRTFLKKNGYSGSRLPWEDEIAGHRRDSWYRPIVDFVRHQIGHLLHLTRIRRRPDGYTFAEDFRRIKRRKLFARDWWKCIGPLYEPKSLECPVRIYGSDQIWSMLSGLELFPIEPLDSCRVIGYAVSGDWKNAETEAWQKKARSVLPRYDALSVREQRGVELVSRLVARPVAHVVDPTFLLSREDYLKVASPRRLFRRPTLFCYLLNLRETGREQVSAVKRLARMRGLDFKICAVQGAERFVANHDRLILSPMEFLAAVRDADCFVTNSFHGTVFALIFEKPFLTVRQDCEKGSNQNVRMIELLGKLGLSSRLVPASEIPAASGLLNRADEIRPEFMKFVEESKNWLLRQLAETGLRNML